MTILSNLNRRTPNLVPLFVLISLFLQGLMIALIFFQGSMLVGLNQKPPPRLVELRNGESLPVKAIAHNKRSPQVIDQFTRQTMQMLYTWSNQVPKGEGNLVKDGGVETAAGEKVARSAWAASFAISQDFRSSLLEKIAELTPRGVFSGSEQVILEIKRLSQPEPVSDEQGKWKQDLVSNLLFFEGNQQERAIAFNKQIFTQAVDSPDSPLPPTPVEQVVYEIRQSGLEIYLIRDFPVE